jgi:chemotaxis protein methyltransferase CheR
LNTIPSTADVEQFLAIVSRNLGLAFDESRLTLVADTLRARLSERRLSAAVYLARLEAGNSAEAREELRALAPALTVTETYFFRHLDQLDAFRDVVLKAHAAAGDPASPLRVLSAGCASGEEPYSIAILGRQHLPEARANAMQIRAVDVNTTMLERAARARYSSWALRETPAEIRMRWFREDGRDFVLDPTIRAMVTFQEGNLGDPDANLWQPRSLDAVFCRNVLMYFAPEAARRVIAGIARALVPGGLLFLGHAETMRGLSNEFHLEHTHGSFYYRLRGEDEGRRDPVRRAPSAPGIAVPLVAEVNDSWVDTIRRASDRVRALTDAAVTRNVPASRDPSPRATWDLGSTIELLRDERYDEARAALRALPAESARDPDVLLLRAVLLTHTGDLARAEVTCNELLVIDEMNAGAHYLLALCREAAGDPRGATDHDQFAAYLDPSFAMPRLHLGLLARKRSDAGEARVELSRALELLEREDPSRILLFGGGFRRDALVGLCRAELVACDGAR